MRGSPWKAILFLLPPCVIAAQQPGSSTWIDKVIEKHGTYLDSTEPMPCGSGGIDDEARLRITALFEKVAAWPNFRAGHTMGTWAQDVASCRVPMSGEQCTKALEEAGVDFTPLGQAEGIETPVRLGTEINGVKLVYKEPSAMDCNLALAVIRMTEVLSALDVARVGIMSLHRPDSKFSFHSLGLAMDMNWFASTAWSGRAWVKTAFEKRKKHKTCGYSPASKKGKLLMDIVCGLWEEKVFNSILTPNYNAGHSNHFHVDLRPGDNRFYLN
jgi:hypothetical protein